MAKIVEKVIGKMKDGKPLILRVNTGSQISRENKTTFQHEKRMKELAKRGHSVEAIKGMMFSRKGEFSGKEITKAIRNPNIKLDGHL